MKRSLRVTLLSILLSLTLFTVVALGVSGYLNLRTVADALTDEVLRQTAARVDQRVEEIVSTAHRQTSTILHLFAAGEFVPEDFIGLGSYWHEIVDSMPTMSSVFLIRADTESAVFVTRSPVHKRITVREVCPSDKGRSLHTYTIRDFRMRSYHEGAAVLPRLTGLGAAPFAGPLLAASTLFPWQNEEGTLVSPLAFDVRTLPGFKDAGDAGRSIWTETHMFFGEEGQLTYPGVSFVTPIRRADGSLLGVFGVGFNVFTLCDFLYELDVDTPGYPFVIEQRRDGSHRLIAHPNREILLEEQPHPVQGIHSELKPLDQVPDVLVPAFMGRIPSRLNVKEIQKLTRVSFHLDGKDYLGGFRGLAGKREAPSWIIGMVLREEEVMGEARKHLRISVLIALAVLLTAVVLSFLTAAQVARPLEELVQDVERIGKLDLEPSQAARSVLYEVDHLARATEDMKTSLRSFRKYVPADLVARLLASGQEAALGGERRRLTIYFSDIANFTTISESMEPERLVEHLGEYLQALSEQILTSGGTVDKYIGDAIMAFWGAPMELPQHALAACTAAVRNQQVLLALRERWTKEGKPLFQARIGINTGEVVVGNIGSAKRLNYTVIGDAVNLASRLEGLNKYYGTQTLISEPTYEEAKEALVARPLDWVSVKGRSTGVLVYELLGLKGETPRENEELAEQFGRALHAYRCQEWTEAIGMFDAVLSRWPDDAPASEMKRRCIGYRDQPPPPGWDGVQHMGSK